MKKASTPSKFAELRSKAEEILKRKQRRGSATQETDIMSLIQEIEVRQIELQVQNEELLQSRLELEESRKAYADLYNLAPIGYLTIDKKGNITAVNELASGILGISNYELYGLRFSSLILADDHKVYFSLIRDVAEGKMRKCSGEIRLLRRKTIPFNAWLEVAASRDLHAQFDGWRTVFQDISGLKRVEEDLRAIPAKLIEAQEKERQRLAMELHDSIGQTLAALKFRIEHVIATMEKRHSEEALCLLKDYVPILQRSIDETRTIYMGLKPTILTEHGILSTLKWYRYELAKLYPDQHVELEMEIVEQDIPDELKITIFRIVQEALNNSFKHGKAEWVDVRLSMNNGSIELEIRDDGVGMDLNSIAKSLTAKSLGLMGMKERAELTGGQFIIKSAPDKGTAIKVVWQNNSQEFSPRN